LSLSYFDPQTKMYQVLTTPAHKLTVSPGDSEKSVATLNPLADTNGNAAGTVKKEIQQLGQDILPIHTDAMNLSVPFRSLARGWIFWLVLMGPLGMYLMLLAAMRMQRLSPERLAQSRSKKAFGALRKQCRKEETGNEDLIQAFKDYLNDRCGLDLGTLTADDAERILQDQGVAAVTANHMRSLIQQLETAVYAGNNFNNIDASRKLLDLVKILEKELS